MSFLQIAGLIVIFGGGIYYLSVAITNWEHFFATHHRVKYIVELLTRNGARVFYGLLGAGSIFIGCYIIYIKSSEPKNQPVSAHFKFRSMEPVQVESPIAYYSNDRFHTVSVKETEDGLFSVTGSAQVFEAAFSWVVKDGEREVASGHEMTDAGAPEWGNFDFTIDVPQSARKGPLSLIIYEVSAKDGSRQHELEIEIK